MSELKRGRETPMIGGVQRPECEMVRRYRGVAL